jgi:hypothetical protein
VPDVDCGALDRLAGRSVDDHELQDQRRPRMSVGDVAPELLVRDVVRALGQFGRQHAGDGTGFDRGRPAALGLFGFPGSRTEAGRGDARKLENRAAAVPFFVHGSERIAVV